MGKGCSFFLPSFSPSPLLSFLKIVIVRSSGGYRGFKLQSNFTQDLISGERLRGFYIPVVCGRGKKLQA